MLLRPRYLFQPGKSLLVLTAINALVLMTGVLLASRPLAAGADTDVRVPLVPDPAATRLVSARWSLLLLADGGALVDGRLVPDAPRALAESVQATAAKWPNSGVRLEVMAGVPFHRVRAAMETCAAAGLSYVDLSTRPEGTP